MRGISKDLKQVLKLAADAGWEVRHTRSCHIKMIPPPGWTDQNGDPVGMIVTGSTESDIRAIKNVKARLRRSGVPVPYR